MKISKHCLGIFLQTFLKNVDNEIVISLFEQMMTHTLANLR